MSLENCKLISQEPLENKDAKWVNLVKSVYSDPHGKTRDWESAERCTRPAGVEFDGVGILAVLQRPGEPAAILLQKQFRPPVGKITIEIPAGLVDANETPEECALRELYEETGYRGEIAETQKSYIMFNDPGMCNTNFHMVHVKIDLNRPENVNPVPQLEECEFIECFAVPMKDLYTECRRLSEQGYAIDARVGSLAEAFEVARVWKFL